MLVIMPIGAQETMTTGGEPAMELWREHKTRLLSLVHIGADGCLKCLDFAPRGTDHLRAILQAGERADGSSLFGRSGIATESSDVLLRPRPETAFVDPFGTTPTLAVLCGHADRDGNPLPQSPDTIVRRAAAHLRTETGHDLWAHGEVEFFLGRPADAGEAHGADDVGYHATSPLVFGQALRRRAIACLSEMRIPIKYAHSEVGYSESGEPGGTIWEQHEIELELLPLPEAADAITLTQWVVGNLASELGLQCSFEPIVLSGHPGNGLHVHFSPRSDDGPVAVGATRDELTEPARWLIGGLLRLGGALMAFGNRSPHSFTRLRQGREVPRHIAWGASDRSALVRLPAVPPAADGGAAITPTIEFRLPDGSAHPHLVLAGAAQAMVLGARVRHLDDLLARTEAGSEDFGTDAPAMPSTRARVADAVARGRAALEAGGVFPTTLLDLVISGRHEPG
jgi:glutamine synthetase